MKLSKLKALLDTEVAKRNTHFELSYEKPDPLLIASRYRDESIALICALFAYGNAHRIIAFLDSLDFALLDENENTIRSTLQKHYYRFQKREDVIALFIALKRLKEQDTLENIFYRGYSRRSDILDGLWELISTLKSFYPHESYGYDFLVGNVPERIEKAGTYKRYLMFLRWMVRGDALDMGLWQKIDKKDLLVPLDTHTFKVSRKLGLLKRKSYDMKAVLELTDTLRKFDPDDPVKYDFALYRLGQEGLV
ncbi:MAG: TIGR02757 family protein [Campylobacterales bacterium]|nr:TIGR02757 family protein [Campylobacterales bacterium]